MAAAEIPSLSSCPSLPLSSYPPPTSTSVPPQIYKIPLMKQSILTVKQSEQLFPSLEELILFHSESGNGEWGLKE